MGSLCGVRSNDDNNNQMRPRQRNTNKNQQTASITKPQIEDKFKDMEDYSGNIDIIN